MRLFLVFISIVVLCGCKEDALEERAARTSPIRQRFQIHRTDELFVDEWPDTVWLIKDTETDSEYLMVRDNAGVAITKIERKP